LTQTYLTEKLEAPLFVPAALPALPRETRYKRERRKLIKTKALSGYSGYPPRCMKCGFGDLRALTIDHVNGRGKEQRESVVGSFGQKFYEWLIKNKFPPGFQVLCMNCNYIKRVENRECVNPHYKK
jgi:hypothetical protein